MSKSKRNEIETFRYFDGWDKKIFTIADKPACLNGFVRIRRYRIICELIEEPHEVLCARLQDLWDRSSNPHDREPLQAEARDLGYELKNYRGTKIEA